jgi:D-alanine-D-alanine ligase
MKIGLAYDLQTDPDDPRQAEFDPPRTLEALADALQALGHEVCRLGGAEALLGGLDAVRGVDLVWNLAEGSRGRCREAWVPALLEQLGVPFVGSGSRALALALDKAVTKHLARACGVSTPDWVSLTRVQECARAEPLGFPLIVKPRHEGSGIGIEPTAVVRDPASLRARVAWSLETWRQPCVVEQFIPFGEVTMLVLGNDPPQALPAVQRPLDPVSRLACHVVPGHAPARWVAPVELSPALEEAAGRAAVAVFEALDCRDVARADFRVDEDGQPQFLEINPLPSLDPEGTVGLIAECVGASYMELIGRILEAAIVRSGLRMTQNAQRMTIHAEF